MEGASQRKLRLYITGTYQSAPKRNSFKHLPGLGTER